MTTRTADAVVIGAGPNGLVAAIALADAGWDVLLLEANETVGGAVRSAEVTAPGFCSDMFSAFYPLAAASRVIQDLDPKLDLSNQVEVRRQIEEIFGKVIDEEGLALTRAERVRMLEQITDEIIGLGPLEPGATAVTGFLVGRPASRPDVGLTEQRVDRQSIASQ